MRRILWVLPVLLLSMLAGVSAALAEKRVALVVGNSAYRHTPKLENPRNDAVDMTATLRRHGFRVFEGLDLDKAAFDRKVLEFAVALKGSDAGLFFYAGHGLQVAGKNYLVPIDAKAEEAATLDLEMVRADVVQGIMERQTETNILFLDACRDNPLARNLTRSMGTRSADAGRGLASVEAGIGTLISFATQPGNVALDGAGRNSPFTGALVKHLAAPSEDLSAILIDVRNDVMRVTKNKQVPWEHVALRARFYFGVPPAPAASPVAVAPSPRASEAAGAWALVEDSPDLRMLDAFRKQYGAANPFFDRLAEARIDRLKQAAETAKRKADAEARTNERERLAMLQREEELKRDEAEAARKEDGARIKVEAERRIVTDSALIKEAQERLYELNYDPGPADGTLSRQTERAIGELETKFGLEATGRLTAGLLDRVKSAAKLAPWGAIALSDTVQKWGMSWSHDTRKAAVAAAQASCAADPSACSRVLTFFGTDCGAFAHSTTRWSLVARETLARARLAALEECQKDGTRCSIVGTVCAHGQGKSVSAQ